MRPLQLERVLPGASYTALRDELRRELGKLRTSGAKLGGLTLRARAHQDIADPDHPAALIYWDALPSSAQVDIRRIVKPHFDLSIMRNPTKRSHALATADEPFNY
jgi:hypothetical protein